MLAMSLVHKLDIPFKTIIKPTIARDLSDAEKLDIPFKTIIKPTVCF